jgi:hypothetical protein
VRVGPLSVGTITDWEPSAGTAITWQPSRAALDAVSSAPVSDVPVSYMQGQHIRGYYEQTAAGLDYSRLMIVSCDAPGRCDVRAMTYVINAHLRRHDTYRSAFSYDGEGPIVRRTIEDPADIEFVPVRHGELTLDQSRELLAQTPDPLQWDCFRFGIVQDEDHFTFFASIDHVHVDAMIVGTTLIEFHMMYLALVGGHPPIPLPDAGSYDAFCRKQALHLDALTTASPQVKSWVEFAKGNDGSMPAFPLPLGDPSVRDTGDIVTLRMMDEEQTARFESACTAAGARFIGGVMACTGLAESELTGSDTYYALTPSDTRSTPTDALTQGWFTGLVPITVPIAGATFGEAARTAQVSFDSGRHLAELPYGRVMELDPSLQKPRPNFPVVNFLDSGSAPLSVLLTADISDLNIGIFSDGRFSYQLSIYVMRVEDETAVAVMFPDNPEAQASVATYLAALKSVFERVAESGHWRNVA